FYEVIEHGIAQIIEDEELGPVGFCCAVVGPLLANATVLTATEIAWWVDPEFRRHGAGKLLLDAMEVAAANRSVKYSSMVALQSSMPVEVSAFYQSEGYTINEYVFTKVLTPWQS